MFKLYKNTGFKVGVRHIDFVYFLYNICYSNDLLHALTIHVIDKFKHKYNMINVGIE